MPRVARRLAIALWVGGLAYAAEEPEGLLDRFLARMKRNLAHLPDYACAQTVERMGRASSERPWEKIDTLRLEVALVGGKERYARAGARQFQDQPLAEMVGRGTIGTGHFALLAKHVFEAPAARFSYRGQEEFRGRRAHAYNYEVAPERSGYRLRLAAEAVVGFQGVFWIDAESLDVMRLEVQAFDIPESVGLAEADSTVDYSRMTLGGREVLLPVSATFLVAATDGGENLNRTRWDSCRQFGVEATLSFAVDTPELPPAERIPLPEETLPARKPLLEISLEADLDPAAAALGDAVRARVARAVKDGEAILIPQGAVVAGRLVRLEKETMPFPMYEIGLEFDTLEIGGRRIPLSATMESAGPAPGLLTQARRLDPTFSRRRAPGMNILVREVQRGQGILHWDARRGAIPRGFRMKWRMQAEPTP